MILRKVGYGMRKLDVNQVKDLYWNWLATPTGLNFGEYLDFIVEKGREEVPSSEGCGTVETVGSCPKHVSWTSIDRENVDLDIIVNSHWEWVEGLLETMTDYSYEDHKLEEYLYKTAFKHGYKHALDGHYPTKEGV